MTDGFADYRRGMQDIIADRLGNQYAERFLIAFFVCFKFLLYISGGQNGALELERV